MQFLFHGTVVLRRAELRRLEQVLFLEFVDRGNQKLPFSPEFIQTVVDCHTFQPCLEPVCLLKLPHALKRCQKYFLSCVFSKIPLPEIGHANREDIILVSFHKPAVGFGVAALRFFHQGRQIHGLRSHEYDESSGNR